MDPVPAPETDPSQNVHGNPCDVCPWHIFYLAVPRFLSPSTKMMGPSLPVWLMKIHIKEQRHYRALSGVLSPWQSLMLTPKHRGKREAWRPSSIIIDCLVLLGLEEKGNSGKNPPTRGPRRNEDSPGNTCPRANWVRRSGSKERLFFPAWQPSCSVTEAGALTVLGPPPVPLFPHITRLHLVRLPPSLT